MIDSILTSTKKNLGLTDSVTAFDDTIVMHINAILAELTQLGVGPAQGFRVEDASATWAQFLGDSPLLNLTQTLVYLKARLIFDPPALSFVIASMEKQIEELTWRLTAQVESMVTP